MMGSCSKEPMQYISILMVVSCIKDPMKCIDISMYQYINDGIAIFEMCQDINDGVL